MDCLLLSYGQANEERFPWDKVALIIEYVPALSGFVLPAEAQHCSRVCFQVQLDSQRDGDWQGLSARSQRKDTNKSLTELPTDMHTSCQPPKDSQRTVLIEQRRDFVDKRLAATRQDGQRSW